MFILRMVAASSTAEKVPPIAVLGTTLAQELREMMILCCLLRAEPSLLSGRMKLINATKQSKGSLGFYFTKIFT